MILSCRGCSEEIEIQDQNTTSAIVVACPVCNAKNKILPKQESVGDKLSPVKSSLFKRIKSWLSL